MKFYSAYGSRPVRLSENTRRFAEESLLGKYGQEAEKTPYVSLDDIPDFESLSPLEKHDAAIRRIAETAPVRICENELISGSATLGAAIEHVIPAYYQSSRIFHSVSHLTVDFESVLRHGTDFIREKVRESLKVHAGTDREAFLISCENCLITPHIAWAAFETRQRLMSTLEKNVNAFLDGKPINTVNM